MGARAWDGGPLHQDALKSNLTCCSTTALHLFPNPNAQAFIFIRSIMRLKESKEEVLLILKGFTI